ncbi:YqzL family protein [Bacillaceae bacterium S4-13-58]
MIDLSWNVFVKTGNIESYLLMKELERLDEYDDEDVLTTEDEPN